LQERDVVLKNDFSMVIRKGGDQAHRLHEELIFQVSDVVLPVQKHGRAVDVLDLEATH